MRGPFQEFERFLYTAAWCAFSVNYALHVGGVFWALIAWASVFFAAEAFGDWMKAIDRVRYGKGDE